MVSPSAMFKFLERISSLGVHAAHPAAVAKLMATLDKASRTFGHSKCITKLTHTTHFLPNFQNAINSRTIPIATWLMSL